LKKIKTPTLSPAEYVSRITDLFTTKGDPIRAEQQRAYMRNQFEYCGLMAPQWVGMLKEIFAEQGTFTGPKLKQFVFLCYDQEYREIQYAGLEMMQVRLKEQDEKWIKVLEKLIITNSWWDSVDWISKLVGIYFKVHPHLQHEYAYKWIHSDNMWLQRAAIIHQLLYKDDVDEKLLFDLIKIQAENKEFFIRKACGWALRQYGKRKPRRVEWFLKHHDVSALTEREALKSLNKI
jgi:3-methyladenine DNA glycosylase AlkD